MRFLFRCIRNFFRRIKQRKIRWVYFDLVKSLPERPDYPRGFIMRRIFPERKLTLAFFRDMLKRIACVKRIKGVIIHLRDEQEGNARRQSIRMALERLKARGKKVIVYAHDYSFLDYYIASVADEIYIQTGGQCFIIGLELQRLFFKDALDRFELSFDSVPISPYKSAMDMFTRSSISKEDREQYQAILDSHFEVISEALATKLKKTPVEVKKIIDNAPYTPQEAKELGLVSDIINNELLDEKAKELAGTKKAKIYSWEEAEKMLILRKPKLARRKIAVISIDGNIVDGESQHLPFKSPIPMIGAEQSGDYTVVHKIRKALEDRSVKALVLEVNSPGGSASASEAIRAATKEFVKKKPMVAYFNDVAASGGYFVATAANEIIAQPLTLTGSIGVIAGKLVADTALENKGVTVNYLRVGEHAGILSIEQSFSKKERKKMEKNIESIYDLFVSHVAELVEKKKEEIEHYCRGRVWSGKDAYKIGLVHKLGDIETAVERAAKLAGMRKGTFEVVDIYESEEFMPSFLGAEDAIISLQTFLRPYTKSSIWFIMPDIIKIR
ncbi:MAG: signal peptide peptidase SppA [Asgard group archaeon]|nr:signal peptide peptidase SppA [Asgard group archaeon]